MGPTLVLRTSNRIDAPQTVEINTVGFSVGQLWRSIAQAYRLGAKTIRVKYEDKQLVYKRLGRKLRVRQEIEFIVTTLLGMEINRVTDDLIVIQQFGEALDQEFDNALRRAFFKLEEEIDDVVKALQLMDYELMRQVWMVSERNLGRFCNFMLRVLHTKGYADYAKTDTLYATVVQLELLGDSLYQIASNVANQKLKKVPPELLKGLFLVKKGFQHYVKYFYTHDEKQIALLTDAREQIREIVDSAGVHDSKTASVITRLDFASEILGNMYDYAITSHNVEEDLSDSARSL